MIDTFQIATEGINPNWNPWNISLKGFGFDVEIIIPEIPPSTRESSGGWWNNTRWEADSGYDITIRIKYKNKEWVQSKRVSSLSVRSLEKVVSSFRRMKTGIVQVYTKFRSIFVKDISIKVKQK